MGLVRFVGREAVAVAAVVNTGLLALISLGFNLTPGQLTTVMTFVNAVLLLVVRANVTPSTPAVLAPPFEAPIEKPAT